MHTSMTHNIVARQECDISVSHLYKWVLRVLTGRGCRTLPRLPKGTKNHHCTIRVMVEASSHVTLYSVVESTQRVYASGRSAFYRVSFRINHVLSERARVKPARVPARKDSSNRKNRCVRLFFVFARTNYRHHLQQPISFVRSGSRLFRRTLKTSPTLSLNSRGRSIHSLA